VPSGGAAAAAPKRILVVGDWHGNQTWAANVAKRFPELLPDQDIKLGRAFFLTFAVTQREAIGNMARG
jgi:hypothetical protein